MAKKLVIVESPAKAKTINKILGSDYVVKSSMGHVRDLPVRALGVEIENGFAPRYVVVKGRKKIVSELRKAAGACEGVYLAPDPDREGEAIAWHLRELLGDLRKPEEFHRVHYNEITPRAVREAFEHPHELNRARFEAQQARRILDRIVGYKVSPVLWRRIRRGLSAGRVQSVALRLICEREQAILEFVPEPYWILGAKARKQQAPLDPFALRLALIDGKKADIRAEEDAVRIRADLESRNLVVDKVATREVRKRPAPPFITSTLQQAASTRHGYSPSRTMAIAQQLYEGVDLGGGPTGLITYMRTDSVAIADEARDACREWITARFGAAFYPEKPNLYRSRASAQEAHEAIRPTDVTRTPESLTSRLDANQLKLYRLIWQRFVASQMAPAVLSVRTVDVDAAPANGRAAYTFRASATDVVFAGYMQVWGVERQAEPKDDDTPEDAPLPPLEKGEALDLLEWLMVRKETKPPARYSEAALVRALEENGVGRPSTYAQILATLNSREYVKVEKRTLYPTDLGMQVNALLMETLSELFDVAFTAQMEASLDSVEEGALRWDAMLDAFYKQFSEWMVHTHVPAADDDAVERVLALLGNVQTWNPPVQNGKRVYSDETFVDSIRKQKADGKKALSRRQLEALCRIAYRYRDQLAGVEALLDDLGLADIANDPNLQPPRSATMTKLELLGAIDLDEKTRDFVNSLRGRAASGRRLTPAQSKALDRIVVANGKRIPDFEALRETLDLDVEEGPDEESGPILEALEAVAEWKPPVTRGKRVFDDRAFFESLHEQYRQRGNLTVRQRAALKRMASRYVAALPNGDALRERFRLGGGTQSIKRSTRRGAHSASGNA
jgi:DNA topoisomerase I